MKFSRILLTGFLLVITLLLGVELGIRYELKSLANERNKLQELFSMSSGSGSVVLGDPEKEVDLSLMWSVWRILQTNYIAPDALGTQKLVYGAVGGMVAAVGDPYTVFMTPTDTHSFENVLSGTLEGIGAELDLRDGLVIVVTPLPGSPAEKAGLKPNDVIIAVDAKPLDNLRLDQVVGLIRGAKGTPVTLSVVHEGTRTAKDIIVTRDSIHIPSVQSRVIVTATGSSAVGYLALHQFGDSSIEEVSKALAEFQKTPHLTGVVVDLRYNGGGYLDGAVDLVSFFLKTGRVVTVVHRNGPPEEHNTTGNTVLPDTPLVVLINSGSASASEIAAGALQDSKRATIIGTQSFGKGTVQEVIDLPGGSALRVTTAKWLTPSGHDLGKKGITPDLVVERTTEQYQSGDDTQLKAALKVLAK